MLVKDISFLQRVAVTADTHTDQNAKNKFLLPWYGNLILISKWEEMAMHLFHPHFKAQETLLRGRKKEWDEVLCNSDL